MYTQRNEAKRNQQHIEEGVFVKLLKKQGALTIK